MPYARKSYKKKSFRKTPYKKANIARMVKSLLPRPEIKKFSSTSTDVDYGDAVVTTGTITQLFSIAQGDNINERQGLRVTPKYIMMRYSVNNADDTTPPVISSDSSILMRIMLVRDKQMNATAPTIAQVLSSVDVNGHLNSAYVGRFQILHDKIHTLVPQTSGGALPYNTVQQYVQKYISLKGKSKLPMVWTSTAGANVSNNQFYVISLRGNDFNSVATQEFGRFNYNFRLGYCDD